MNSTLFLVHGAWHNAAGFDSLREELAKLGISAKSISLKSSGDGGDMYGDAEIVRAAIEAAPGDCIILAHSYGGLAITEGAAGNSKVKALIYLTAFMLDEGESLYAACGGVDPEWWVRNSENTLLTTNNPAEVFYNTCSPEVAKRAVAQLRTQSISSFMQPITKAAWKSIPSTYIICERDQAIPLFAQEAMSQRASKVVRIDSDHSPFLSKPAELAALILEIDEEVNP
jgi:pimeloyl-ACP methyl ester carboxylesterase